MGNPYLLLLDELTEGLAALIVKVLGEQILTLKQEGLAVLLREQNVKFATELSDRAYVIEKGSIRCQGSIEDFRENEEVKKKYLAI